MKRILVSLMAVALLFTFSPCGSTWAAGVTDILPENTDVMVKFSSIDTLYKQLSVTENSIFGQPVDEIEEIKKDFGFNPLLIKDLKANGVDTGKEIGVIIENLELDKNGDDHNIKGAVFIPVTNGKKFIETIKAASLKDEPTMNASQKGNITILQKEGDMDKLFMAEKNGFVFLNPADSNNSFMDAILKGATSLTKNKMYNDVVKKVTDKEEVFVYLNMKSIMEKNADSIASLSSMKATPSGDVVAGQATTPSPKKAADMARKMKYMKEYEGAGFSLDLDKKDLDLKAIFNMIPGAKSMEIMKDLNFKKGPVLGIKENPALFLSSAVNALKYYDYIKAIMTKDETDKLNKTKAMFKTDYGIDLDKEIIGNMGGNLNIGVYDGMSISMGNYNTLLTLSVKDEKIMEGVIDKAIAKLPPEEQAKFNKTKIGNDDVYVAMMGVAQLYATVKDNNLILTLGKAMFDKATAGNPAQGFVKGIKDKKLAESFKGDVNVFYISMGEVMKAVMNFMPMFQAPDQPPIINDRMQAAIGKIDHLIGVSRLDGNSIVSDMMVKTNFNKSFMIGLLECVKEFQPGEQPPAP